MLHGFDISAYQGITAPAGDFDLVKATEGRGYTSSKFAAQWASAARHAKVRGAYHFARPEESTPEQQADRLINAARPVRGELLCLDLEASKLSQIETNSWARTFGDRLRERAPGVTTVLYMGSGYATSNTGRGLARYFDFWMYPQYPSAYQVAAVMDVEELRAANRSSLIAERTAIAAATSLWPPSVAPWLPSGLTCGWTKPDLWQFTDNWGTAQLDASVTALTLDQLAAGERPTPKEEDVYGGAISAGQGEKTPIVFKAGAFSTLQLAWDNTLTMTTPPIARKAPASFRLAPHIGGRKGTTVEVTVGAALDDTKGRPDCATVKLPAGCDYIGVVRLDDGDAPVGFSVF